MTFDSVFWVKCVKLIRKQKEMKIMRKYNFPSLFKASEKNYLNFEVCFMFQKYQNDENSDSITSLSCNFAVAVPIWHSFAVITKNGVVSCRRCI